VLLLTGGAVCYAGVFSLFGPVQPVPEKMAKAVAPTFVSNALCLFAGSIGGIAIRIFIVIKVVA
jgi:hypothetical protein